MRKFFGIFILMMVIFGSPILAQLPVGAVGSSTQCSRGFLGFPNWFRGLTKSSTLGSDGTGCDLVSPAEFSSDNDKSGLTTFISHIALNVIEIIAMVVGYITVAMISFGGFQYLTSAGNADNTKKAKTTVTNAAIGLVISLSAFAITNLITGIWR